MSSIIITFSLGNCNVSLLVVPLSPNISILIGPTVSAKCESRVVHVTKYFDDRFVESLLKLLTARWGDAGNGSYGVGFLIIDLADLVVTNEMVSVSDVSVDTGVCGIELLFVDDLLSVGVVLLSVGFLTFPNPLPIKQTSFG